MPMRSLHRIVTFFVVLFTLYLGATGTLIQLVDLRSILTHAPAADANVRAMRESFNGPGDYAVISTADYTARTLPEHADYDAMVETTLKAGHGVFGAAPFSFIELREANGRSVGQVKSGREILRVDAVTGATVSKTPEVMEDQSPASDRNTVKHLHRMTTFGDWALWINIAVSIALVILLVTGTIMYWQLLKGRWKLGRKALIWSAGGVWKTLHRAFALSCAAFLVVVTLSGAWLAVESLGLAFYFNEMRASGKMMGPPPDPSSPLKDAELPAMLHTTLGAFHNLKPDVRIRVVRLRYYGGMAQGAVITNGEKAQQYVFNAVTGRRVSETEPGYPRTPFPFGWQAHQIAKSIHRGDIIGISGRWMDLLAGLAMIYLSVSGVVMYFDLWKRRQKAGRKALIWK
jgi:uncharacterized iron-regulated membrane protein